jgi:tetratricopeptide (TPR) repeat protein
MEQVRALQGVGQFDASIAELQKVLEVDPEQPEANYRLGLALVQTGEPEKALWPLEKAAESSSYEISAGVLLASTHFQTHNYDEAVRAADRVLAVDPERQTAMRIRAKAYLAARNPEAAYRDSDRLVTLYPEDYGVRALHATVLAALGRLEEAEREHELLKRMGQESDDPDFRSRSCLSPAIFAQDVLKDTEKAKALYEDCASRSPTDTIVLDHLVSFFDGIGEPERGTELWREAVKAAPDKLDLRQGLAARLQSVGEPGPAEQVLRDAVETFHSSAAWGLLASFYRARGEPGKALEAIDKVLSISGGDDERVLFVQADVLIDMGQFDRASAIADGLSQTAYAELLRGRIHLARGEPGPALEAFEKGIREWPNNAGAHYLAGIAARDLGDFDRAISELREAVRANNAETDAALDLSRLYLDRGQYQQALTFANLALRGRGGQQQPEPYAIAARALLGLGRVDRARKAIGVLEERGFAIEALRERVLLEGRVAGPAAGLAAAEESGVDLGAPAAREVLEQVVALEIEAGRPADAIARIDDALSRSPDDAGLLVLRGSALASAKRSEEAQASFERALVIDPHRAAALGGLARLRAAAGDSAGAIALFDRAYEAAPRAGAYAYASAQLALSSGETSAAIERLRDVVRRHPEVAGARNDLAWLLAERGEELDLALSLAEEARRRSASPAVLDTLGWVHYQRGEYDQAVEALQAAVDADGSVPSRRYRLGLALQEA